MFVWHVPSIYIHTFMLLMLYISYFLNHLSSGFYFLFFFCWRCRFCSLFFSLFLSSYFLLRFISVTCMFLLLFSVFRLRVLGLSSCTIRLSLQIFILMCIFNVKKTRANICNGSCRDVGYNFSFILSTDLSGMNILLI